MNLFDQAARALAESQGGDKAWDAFGSERRAEFRKSVRAVLEVLRDPSEAMAEAGAEIVRNVGPAESELAYRSDAADTWRFMIDVLLDAR